MKHYPEHNLDPTWQPFAPHPELEDAGYEMDDVALVEIMARNHPAHLLHTIKRVMNEEGAKEMEATAAIEDKEARNTAKNHAHRWERIGRLAERGAQLCKRL